MGEAEAGVPWLVLVYQFPQGPGSLRVKVWRRLQSIGAVAIKNSVYVLPQSEQSREDFEWLLVELTGGGAEGAILEARFVDGLTDEQVRHLFRNARNEDYAALAREIEAFVDELPAGGPGDRLDESRRLLARARKRLADIEAIDFFGADGHQAADTALRTLSECLSVSTGPPEEETMTITDASVANLKDRVWVTRRNVRVDRIASAWLIRRWIDADAAFKFVAGKSYRPADGEIRFDMYEGEFTHQADRCTFEVLAGLVRPDDAALQSIAEIVHDIDLKDEKFGRVETQGVANLLEGIVAGIDDDIARIERGSAMFDDLYRFFSGIPN